MGQEIDSFSPYLFSFLSSTDVVRFVGNGLRSTERVGFPETVEHGERHDGLGRRDACLSGHDGKVNFPVIGRRQKCRRESVRVRV